MLFQVQRPSVAETDLRRCAVGLVTLRSADVARHKSVEQTPSDGLRAREFVGDVVYARPEIR